ncbi:laminin G domain containing protein [Nitzschia inconspicua]|uniref:Laminin G domain containing protein n=1 Tax=Nitzschia inconspicua TaxID=303405 RepID=A0A9K3LKK2_9STRA|nr:laminin G domain containing protein [Nitzschia inconspicua]
MIDRLATALVCLLALVNTQPTNARGGSNSFIGDRVREDQRFVVFNSRSLSGECLPICVPETGGSQDPITQLPTGGPTVIPTAPPTNKPTAAPTNTPTPSPTVKPTASPTNKPTAATTNPPSPSPTVKPTASPTNKPTAAPTNPPTPSPTSSPTIPTAQCVCSDANSPVSYSWKCGTDLYYCASKITSVCGQSHQADVTLVPLNDAQCTAMQAVKLGEKCLLVSPVTQTKSLSHKVCYSSLDPLTGFKFDGGCDKCKDYVELPPLTLAPTVKTTAASTTNPTIAPTPAPTNKPTAAPTNAPTPSPTNKPTAAPTNAPTPAPTNNPTAAPTNAPTPSPTNKPTAAPTNAPTPSPTNKPTAAPTNAPTPSPTNKPTAAPTNAPTPSPTNKPTAAPTNAPTPSPTNKPTAAPTNAPTPSPTNKPTATPTNAPTPSPTNKPTATPTNAPTPSPTTKPTSAPTNAPTPSPTTKPASHYICVWPADTLSYTMITKNDATAGAHNFYTKMAIGGTLYDGAQDISKAVDGKVFYGALGQPSRFNFNKGHQQINSLADVPIDFAHFEWLAQNLKAGTYGSKRVFVVTQPKSGCYTTYDFIPGGQPNIGADVLVVFNTAATICLTKTSDGRQFGPTVLAPFSHVELKGDAGYIDGTLISKSFTTSGSNASNLQMHGKMYSGTIECPAAPTSCVCSDANSPVSYSWKCGTDLYYCATKITSVCSQSYQADVTLVPLNDSQCTAMQAVKLGEKCLTVAPVTQAKSLSHKVCYSSLNPLTGSKFDGSCDNCQSYVALPGATATAPTQKPTSAPTSGGTSCIAKWGDCTSNSNGCCSGSTCVYQNQWYSQCL